MHLSLPGRAHSPSHTVVDGCSSRLPFPFPCLFLTRSLVQWAQEPNNSSSPLFLIFSFSHLQLRPQRPIQCKVHPPYGVYTNNQKQDLNHNRFVHKPVPSLPFFFPVPALCAPSRSTVGPVECQKPWKSLHHTWLVRRSLDQTKTGQLEYSSNTGHTGHWCDDFGVSG